VNEAICSVFATIFCNRVAYPEQKIEKKKLSKKFIKEISPVDEAADRLQQVFMKNCRKYIFS